MRYNGQCPIYVLNDTNPEKESVEYIESIKRDVEWLGFEWKDEPKFAFWLFCQFVWFCNTNLSGRKAYALWTKRFEPNAPNIAAHWKSQVKNSPSRDRV